MNLYDACDSGNLERVKYFVEQERCDLNNTCAIRWASRRGHLELVKYLVSVGCDPKAGDEYAIRWASRMGHLETVKYLVSIGCNPAYLNNWAIITTSAHGSSEVVKYLVSIGCDYKVHKNKPIRLAIGNGNLNVVRYLATLPDGLKYVDEVVVQSAHFRNQIRMLVYLFELGYDYSFIKKEIRYQALQDVKIRLYNVAYATSSIRTSPNGDVLNLFTSFGGESIRIPRAREHELLTFTTIPNKYLKKEIIKRIIPCFTDHQIISILI